MGTKKEWVSLSIGRMRLGRGKKVMFRIGLKSKIQPWPVWLSWLECLCKPKITGSFPVRAPVWVAGWVPVGMNTRGNQWMFPSLALPLLFTLSLKSISMSSGKDYRKKK